jgi:hypothetical protein
MPHHERRSVTGTILYVFGHRFVVETKQGVLLADITPKGLEKLTLRAGDIVTIDGEMKPTELKVESFTRAGKTVVIDHHKPHHHDDDPHHHHDHPPADPAIAISAAQEAGFAVIGDPRRKPKHFEVLGKRRGALSELHVALDGHIRKMRPVTASDPKWADGMQGV